MARNCDASCSQCGRDHHYTLCQEGTNERSNPPQERQPRVEHVNVAHTQQANDQPAQKRMMTAKVEVRNPTTGQTNDAELLIDTGASISLIDANFVEEMQLESAEGNPVFVTGIGGTRLEKPLTKYSLVHLLTKEGAMDVKLLHIRSPIVSDISKAQISEDDRKFLSRSAYDKAEMDTSRPPDILLCLSDALPILEGTSVHRLPSGLHLISTKVGDIVAGEQKKHRDAKSSRAWVRLSPRSSPRRSQSRSNSQKWWGTNRPGSIQEKTRPPSLNTESR